MAKKKSQARESIMAAAVELFREQGYDKVSVNAICQRAYVAHSTFYYMFSGKEDVLLNMLRDVTEDEPVLTEALMFAKNDFERMWTIGCRYLDICLKLGPEITASVYELELHGTFPLYQTLHSSDEWFLKFTENSKEQGLIRSSLPSEFLAPFILDSVSRVVYEWCVSKGSFPLLQRSRMYVETICDAAPEIRMTEEQLAVL